MRRVSILILMLMPMLMLPTLVLTLTVSACIEGKTRPPDGRPDVRPGDASAEASPDAGPGGVMVPSGVLQMGPRAGNPCAAGSQRNVTLTRSFELAETEVTRSAFLKLMGYRPSTLGAECETCPVIVSWYEAAAYCNELSAQGQHLPCYQCAGKEKTLTCALDPKYSASAKKTIHDCPGYRLPTEAEWEHAYRAGTQTDLYNGNITEKTCSKVDPAANLIAWYCHLDGNSFHPVGEKLPNGWGLYDMAGNAWEWCADGYQVDLGGAAATDPWAPDPINKEVAQRGGDYYAYPCNVRAVARRSRMPTEWGGFRCARSLP
jgi:formylglycine-generating enzyme required for sulfatase activity